MKALGFKPICHLFWEKDGVVYHVLTDKPETATPVEIIGVHEITKNSRLVQLEIRYRANGNVKSWRIGGTSDQLLTIEDKLGFGGFIANPFNYRNNYSIS